MSFIKSLFSSPDTTSVQDLGSKVADTFGGTSQKNVGHLSYTQKEIIDLNYVLKDATVSSTPVRRKDTLASQIDTTKELVKTNMIIDAGFRLMQEARGDVSKKLDKFVSTNYELISQAKELKTKSEGAFNKALGKLPDHVSDAVFKLADIDLSKYTPAPKPVVKLESEIVGKSAGTPVNKEKYSTPHEMLTDELL